MSLLARIRTAGLPLTVLVLAGCLMEPMPECDVTTCGTEEGRVTAVGEDRSVLWSTDVRDAAEISYPGDPDAPPVVHVHDGHVVVDGCRAVHVLEAATGAVVLDSESMERVWTVTDDLVVGSPRDAAGGRTDARGLAALPLAGADASWVRLPTGERVVQGVVEVDGGLAVLSADVVFLLRPDGPTTVVTLAEAVASPSVGVPLLVRVDDHTVAVLHDDGAVEAVDTARGRSVWTVEPSKPARATAAARLGKDVVLSWGSASGGEVVRVAADGTVAWRVAGALPRPVLLDPAAVVVPLQRQSLTAVAATDGEPLPVAPRPRPAQDLPVLSDPDAVAWTASGIGTTSAWSARRPTGSPLWTHEGVLVGRAAGGTVLRTGRSSVQALTAVDARGADLWRVAVGHEAHTATPVPGVGTVVTDLEVELVRSRDCDDYPARHTVPAASLR